MIRSFRSRALAALWDKDDASRIPPDLVSRARVRLSALSKANKPDDLNLPGFNFHKLRGKPTRWSVHINGPWCITFEWDGEDATRIDLEQYH